MASIAVMADRLRKLENSIVEGETENTAYVNLIQQAHTEI